MENTKVSTKITVKHVQDQLGNERKMINTYMLMGIIGQGAYATVKSAIDTKSGKKCAVQKMNQTILKKQTELSRRENGETYHQSLYENVLREIEILQMLNHQNVIKLIDILDFEQVGKLYIITDLAEKGDVLKWDFKSMKFSHPNPSNTLNYKYLQKIMKGCIEGFQYIHSLGIVHRDVKPQNILVDQNQEVKICDFGIAYVMKNSTDFVRGTVGTQYFWSPESLKENPEKKGYDGRISDVWSLGLTFYILFHLKLPFYHNVLTELFNQIQNQEPHYDSQIDPDALDLIEKMLIKQPEKRITLNELLKHPFIIQVF